MIQTGNFILPFGDRNCVTFCLKSSAARWWCEPLIPAEAGKSLEFRANQDYIVKACLKKRKKKKDNNNNKLFI